MIEVNNDYRLIALALLVSSISIWINIEIIKRLFIADNHIKNRFSLGIKKRYFGLKDITHLTSYIKNQESFITHKSYICYT